MPVHLRLASPPAASKRMPSVQDPIRVVLADDHGAARRHLRLLLDTEEDLHVVAEGGDLSAVAASHVPANRSDVLVLDLGLPRGPSIETIRRLRARSPDARVLVLTMDDDPVFARQALNAGATGFVLKEMADADLAPAIRASVRGERYVSPRMSARMKALDLSLSEDSLTSRETEVLRLTALGHTSIEIARKLQLSPRTVETHRVRIHRKLGSSTRAELVRYALGRGLLGV